MWDKDNHKFGLRYVFPPITGVPFLVLLERWRAISAGCWPNVLKSGPNECEAVIRYDNVATPIESFTHRRRVCDFTGHAQTL